jgi:Tol biopolymer transport system component
MAAAAAFADNSTKVHSAADRQQSTQLISSALGGGSPNGPSTNAVISGDRRYARVIAFESEASNLVAGDTNGVKDVFAVKRNGSINNKGTKWSGGNAILVSRGLGGAPADGPSSNPSVSGDFRHKGSCIAFLSAASNLVPGDSNGKVDAFLVKAAGKAPRRVSLPGGAQSAEDTTAVTVSGDCTRVSFVTGGKLYTTKGRKTKAVASQGAAADPSYASGNSSALVFGADGGVYLSAGGTGRAKLVAAGGRNPVFNDLKRRTLAYEKSNGGRTQIYYKDLGKGETVISDRKGDTGNGDSRDPVIGNSGYYVSFESAASNLGVNALGRTGDSNNRPDAYLYTNVRDLTLVQSVKEKAVPVPGGGENPSMSYYANYIVFDSPAPLGDNSGNHQIYMRYLGEV